MRKTSIILSATAILSLPFTGMAQDVDTKPTRDALPALKILPEGSVLNKVRVPRFNKDLSPASLLLADKLTVLTKESVSGENVDITLFGKQGITRAHTSLKSVVYNQTTGIINAQQNLTLDGENFAATAQGVALHWEKRQGFLLGKTKILFYINQAKPMTSSTNPSPKTPSKLKSKIAAATVVASALSTPLTATQLKEIDELAKPMPSQSSTIDAIAERELSESASAAEKLDQTITEFKKMVGAEAMTIKNEQEPTAPTANKPGTQVRLESDGGTFFDAEKGVAVCTKNIVITHPQYKLTCTDELKIFLKKAAAEKAKDTPLVDPMQNLGDIDKAIATGNVVITGKDKNGILVVAKAETATYNHQTGVFILKGGYPSVKHGDNIGRILDTTGYIMITPTMSMRMVGKNEIKADIPNKK